MGNLVSTRRRIRARRATINDSTRSGRGTPRARAGGGTNPTLADLAARLGVTSMAVSLALNDRPGVSDELRAAAKKLAAEIGYRPNFAARALRTERTSMMGIINRNLHNPAFLGIIEGFDEECSARGYQVMIGSSRLDLAHELALIEAFAAREIEGLAIAPLEPASALQTWQRKSERPIAILNALTPTTDGNVLSVRSDAALAVRLAVEHLVALGHERIALITNSGGMPSDVDRDGTFLEESARRGIQGTLLESGWGLESARAAIAATLRAAPTSRPTAIIANSDHLAHAVYLAARDAGVSVPDELSVVGHDDLDTSQILGPPLTTFRTDRFAIGQLAARLLIDTAEGTGGGTTAVDLPVVLEVRASTAVAPR